MSRTHMTLAFILVVQVALILIGSGAAGVTESKIETLPLLPGMDSFTPGRLEIHGAGEDESITLVRKGAEWGIAEAGNYPADSSKLDTLLTRLKGLEIRRPVVTNSTYHESLKVSDDAFERRLRIFREGADSPEFVVYLGTSPNYRIIHARRGVEDEVYPVSDIAAYDVRADKAGWVDFRFTDWEFDEVVRARLENSKGVLELERTDEGWSVVTPAMPEGRELNVPTTESLVRTATSLTIAEPQGVLDENAQGLKAPAATLILTFESKPEPGAPEGTPGTRTEKTLRIGGLVDPDGENQERFVARSGFDFVASARDYNVKRFLETGLEEILKEVPAEEPPAPDPDPEPKEEPSESGEAGEGG